MLRLLLLRIRSRIVRRGLLFGGLLFGGLLFRGRAPPRGRSFARLEPSADRVQVDVAPALGDDIAVAGDHHVDAGGDRHVVPSRVHEHLLQGLEADLPVGREHDVRAVDDDRGPAGGEADLVVHHRDLGGRGAELRLVRISVGVDQATRRRHELRERLAHEWHLLHLALHHRADPADVARQLPVIAFHQAELLVHRGVRPAERAVHDPLRVAEHLLAVIFEERQWPQHRAELPRELPADPAHEARRHLSDHVGRELPEQPVLVLLLEVTDVVIQLVHAALHRGLELLRAGDVAHQIERPVQQPCGRPRR